MEAIVAPDGPLVQGYKFIAFVDDTKTEVQSRHGSHPDPDEETLARAFNKKSSTDASGLLYTT
jgi:hypothetical protein